jgi:Raf kinase inhibitor-like YbhB/YbcL family protein
MKASLLTLALGALLIAEPALAQGKKMVVGSTDVKAKETIGADFVFNGFGCTGKNKSPALSWSNAPEGTKSFAVTMYDPDAPTGSGWWHWVVFNIPAGTARLAAGAGDPAANLMPAGAVQSMTDFGKPGYGGPCPPQGAKPHRYVFTVHALKVDKIPLDDKAPGAMAGFFINANSLAKAAFTAMYGR